jgi:hypothetical protein
VTPEAGALPQAAASFALPDWPLNAWYAAAYDVEVGRTLLPRTIGDRTGEPLAAGRS